MNEIIILPEEVKTLATQISDNKKEEVESILTQIFTGTADWDKQIEAIEIKGIDDVMGIQLADVARKNVKNARLSAEKLFDVKREEVQIRMHNDKLEDSLWLKAKQIMILKFKAIEDKATYKAETVKRYEAQQKELKIQSRLESVYKYKPDINRVEIENMGDEMFGVFLNGLKTEHDKRIEDERKTEEARIVKEKADREEREQIIAENEKLKKEREEKEKLLAIEQKKQEETLAKQKAEAEKQRKEQEAKLKKEREEKEKLERELKAKKELELKAERERKNKEREEKEANKKAERAPDKDKLLAFAKTIETLPIPNVKSEEAAKVIYDISTLINKLRQFIIDEANKL